MRKNSNKKMSHVGVAKSNCPKKGILVPVYLVSAYLRVSFVGISGRFGLGARALAPGRGLSLLERTLRARAPGPSLWKARPDYTPSSINSSRSCLALRERCLGVFTTTRT